MIAPGEELAGRYRVEALIASGGMADVFLARDTRLDREVAVKMFRIGASEPQRFDAEIQMLARLHHPNLVSVFDAGEHREVPFVVLEHVPGQTLASRLSSGPLEPDQVRRLATDVASALQYIHAHQIVHRDVKPSNILFDTEGRARLGDFGVAVLLDATRLTIDGTTIGTAAYLAPEQATGSSVDGGADVYALGLVLIEAITGRAAFTGSLQEVIAAKLSRDPVVPDVGPPWVSLLGAMTRRDPAGRPLAGAVLGALGAAGTDADATIASEATSVLPAPAVVAAGVTAVPPSTWRRRWGRPLAAALAMLGLGMLLALLAWAGDGTDPDPPPAATTSTVAPTTSPPTTSRDEFCQQLDEEKKAIEEEKKDAGGRGKDDDDDDDDGDGDKDLSERLKRQFEDQIKDVEVRQKNAGC